MRMWISSFILFVFLCFPLFAAANASFQEDVAFLKTHLEDVVVLSDEFQQAQIAIVPAYQGRVMTSTAKGGNGLSFGWLNRELIASAEFQAHINAFGGEDRFWMGPEGGQFSIFFEKGDPFDLEHWQTPAFIDTKTYDVVKQTEKLAVFHHRTEIENMSGTKFDLFIHRAIELLAEKEIETNLDISIPSGVDTVGFSSRNYVTNMGDNAWKKESGALSIWILGMFNPSPATTVVIPFKQGPVAELGPVVNDAYFGKVPADRLKVTDGIIYFSGDGQYRSKIGLTPMRAKPVMGSYDAANQVLTIVQYNKPKNETDYVNSMWEMQEKPFAGDAVNSYNDGPPEPGKAPLGPFYELETSSPAAFLKPRESITHIHRTYHFQGEEEGLNRIAQQVLGVDLETVKKVF